MRTKKVFAVLLGVALLISVMPTAGLSLGASAEETQVIAYVDATTTVENGEIGNTTKPYQTINAAITALNAMETTDDLVIEIIGAYTVADTVDGNTSGTVAFAAHSKLITIKGYNSSASLSFAKHTTTIGGPLKIDEITLSVSGSYNLCTNGHPLEIGDKVTKTSVNDGRLAIGSYCGALSAKRGSGVQELVLNTGEFQSVRVGDVNKTISVSGVDFEMNGGMLKYVFLGSDSGTVTFTENVNIELNGGSFVSGYGFNNKGWALGDGAAMQIIANNGFNASWYQTTAADVMTQSGKGNMYVLNCAKGGSTLHATDETGVYEIADPTYKATATDGTNTYTSQNGVLTIPAAGVYTVTWALAPIEYASTVYVDNANGDDGNAGTEAKPLKTINAAITALDALENVDDRVIIIQGDYTVNGADKVSTYPAFVPHENLITIKGEEGAVIDLTGVVSVGGPIKFDDITYTFTNNNSQICASGYPVEFGAGAVPASSENRGRVHSGGYHSQLRDGYETREHNLITSSDFYFVWLGEANPNGKKYTVPGVNYVMNGGWVGRLAIGANTSDTARANYFTGNVNIELNSGTVAQIRTTYSTLANYAPDVAVQVIANNGFVLNWTSNGSTVTDESPVLRDDDGKENLYVIKSAKGGSTLHATKDTGVYKIADPSYKAIATDGTNTYTSQNGVLTVPAAGTYTVTWTQAEIEYASTVYVSENGSDESTVTGTQENPFKTINAAIEALNTVAADNKQIYILDTAELPAELTANTDKITITGDSDSQLLMTQNVTLGGDFVFGGVAQTHTAGSPQYRFMTNGHSVSFCGDMAYGTYPHTADVSLGKTNTNVGKVTLELSDMALYRVYTGSHYNTKDVTAAGADITINSGSVYRLFVGANGWAGAPGTTTYTENVNIIFNGGSIGEGLIRLSNAAAQDRYVKFADGKALQVIFNNGKGGNITVVDNDDLNTPYVADHFYRLNCAEKVFLSPTPDTGVYKVDVPEGMFAIAKKDGKVAGYAADGEMLRLGEAGTYTVDYAESATYFLSEDAESGLVTLEVNIDFTIDFDTFAIIEKEGYIFNGWLDAEGNAVTNPALTAGTVLTAQYVEKKDNFYMVGTQIRPKTEDKEQALRFIVHLGKNFGINYTEKGTVVIPNTILGVNELVVGGNYVYNSKPYSAQSVVGEKLWASTDDYVQYTAALTGITNYLTAYAARGYIKYTDLNGVVRIAYTDKTPAASLNEVAEMLLDRDPDDTAAKEIADAAKAAIVSKYADTTKPLTSNTVFSSATSANTTINEEIYNNSGVYTTSDNTAINFYKLNGKLSTLVTEVAINAVGENSNLDPTTIMQLTDIHFTYADDVDIAENNIYTMTSWSQRQGNGTFFTSDLDFSNYRMQWILKTLEYSAAVGDQTVVTGDMIDFISHGNLTLMNRAIAEPYSNSLMVVGNHEPVRLVSETASLSDPNKWSAEYYEILNKFWVDHDLTYTSKMVGKEVMVIQMDNSHYFFTQAQVDKLTADLAIARENGYTVLIFTHIPFVPTDGASSQELLMGKGGIAVGPDSTKDSYYIETMDTNQSLVDGRDADWTADGKTSFTPAEHVAATEAMYNLIVDNGDIVKGVFNGHKHNTIYSRLYKDGGTVVPQYTLAASFIDGGVAMKITVQ